MVNRKITQRDLDTIFTMTKAELLNSRQHHGLDTSQNNALCYLKVISGMLGVELDFRNFEYLESVDDND